MYHLLLHLSKLLIRERTLPREMLIVTCSTNIEKLSIYYLLLHLLKLLVKEKYHPDHHLWCLSAVESTTVSGMAMTVMHPGYLVHTYVPQPITSPFQKQNSTSIFISTTQSTTQNQCYFTWRTNLKLNNAYQWIWCH